MAGQTKKVVKINIIDDEGRGTGGLWNAVWKTPVVHTRQANNGYYDFTCVDPQYMIMEATRLWGPYGRNWGIRGMVWERFDVGGVECLALHAEFFYPQQADDVVREVSFEMAVDTKFRPGRDSYKICQTMLQSKALSKLGFSADVYLGMFDNEEYVKGNRIAFLDESEQKKEIHTAILTSQDMTMLNKIGDSIERLKTRGEIPDELADWLMLEWKERESVLAKKKPRKTESKK